MKLSFLSAKVETHIEAFFECILKGGYRWRSAVNPKSRNTHRCGMPTESARFADVRFIQRLLQEDVDGEVRAGHVQQHRDLGQLVQ